MMKRVLVYSFILFLAAALFSGCSGKSSNETADLILHNGKIVTVDSTFAIHQAISVKGNRILKTGRNREILRLKGEETEIIDLNGKTVLPGLIDSHTHLVDAAMSEFDHPIPDMEDIGDVLNYIRSRTKVLKEGQWIVTRFIFITRLREQRYPTRAELDSVAPKHPVMFSTGPDASLNSLALKLSGIGRNFRITDGGTGFVEKNPVTGEPTGIIRSCSRYVKVISPEKVPSREEKLQQIIKMVSDYNSAGITTIGDRDLNSSDLELYKSLLWDGKLTMRVAVTKMLETTLGSLEKIQSEIRDVAKDTLFTRKNDFLQILGIKTYMDGGMLTGSAHMLKPWGVSKMYGITDPEYRGVPYITKERLLPIIRTAMELDLQVASHTVGDGAVHALLDVYNDLYKVIPEKFPETRPCISHSNFMSAESVDLASRIGVSIDMQPAWLYLDAHTLQKQFGYERLRWFQPLKTIFEKGIVAGGGSDHMIKIGSMRSVNPYNPFLGMATAITRRGKSLENVLHPEEALDRQQAIRFYTINNAWLLFRENELGSLEAGKLADLVVIDTDILDCSVSEIMKTKVLRTYLGGKLVYEVK